jgi:hypothetical protein
VKINFTRLFLAFGVLLNFVVLHQSFSQSFFSSSRDWKFVQSVGGLIIGTPSRDGRKHIILPIRCNLAPKYSGLACDLPAVHVDSTNVFLTIRTILPGKRDASCPSADLGKLAGGDYSVFYLNPDGTHESLGSIRVPSL